MNDRHHLDRLARRLVASGRFTGPVVIVGHSAGAASGTWLAPRLIDAGVEVRGLVYVDGNDSPNHLIKRSWSEVAGVPIRAVMAPASPCNRNGRLTRFLTEHRPGSVEVIAGAGHGDIEMSRGIIYRRFCGDSSDPETWNEVQEATLRAVAGFVD